MYIGRIVMVGLTSEGKWCGAYRVSSRSFPNRTAVLREARVSIVPKPGHEGDVHKNPYIAYNCVRLVCDGRVAVVTNGSQTDPIAEKMASGMAARDALVMSLLALDYEKDDYNTPRIAAVVDVRAEAGWLGVVRDDGLNVRRIPLEPGRCFHVATYEENDLAGAREQDFPATNADDACRFILGGGLFAERENPVSAVAAVQTAEGFELTCRDAEEAGS